MRKLVLILLCFALYVPNLVQIFSFYQCTVIASNNKEQSICDCLFKKNNITSSIPVEKNQHQIVKEEWKFIVMPSFNINNDKQLVCTNNLYKKYTIFFPSTVDKDIFHPPIS